MDSLSSSKKRSVVGVSDYMSTLCEQKDLYNWCDTTSKIASKLHKMSIIF